MSTIKVNAIQHTTANSGNMLLHANGNVSMITSNTTLFVGNTAISNAGISVGGAAINPLATGMRNRIINGAMQIWQRGTSNTGTPSTVCTTADRWAFYSPSSSMTSSQSTSAPTGFQYSLKVQRPASAVTTTAIYAYQVVESVNMLDMAGQTVTLSFWAKAGANFSPVGNVFTAVINTGTVADQGAASGLGGWTGAATPGVLNQTLTTTWTNYSVTCVIPANALELDVVFYYNPTGTAGADDAFYITGVQLEVGSVATPFERRLYGQELALCQRYFCALYPSRPAWCSTSFVMIPITWPVSMRTVPTVTAPYTDANYTASGAPTGSQWNIQQVIVTAMSKTGTATVSASGLSASDNMGFIVITGATFSGVGDFIATANTMPNITVSAEL